MLSPSNRRKSIDETRTIINDAKVKAIIRRCAETAYFEGISFVSSTTGETPDLTAQDITQIESMTDSMSNQYWESIQSMRETLQRQEQLVRDERTKKTAGAAFTEGFSIFDMINNTLTGVLGVLAVQSLNAAILENTKKVSPQIPSFRFVTVGDDRVCPICTPLDQTIMSESTGNIQQPPLHRRCRCFLFPIVKRN